MGLALKADRLGFGLPKADPQGHTAPAARQAVLGVVPTPTPAPSPNLQRWVWEHRFGRMCIEVRDGQVFVDGQRVEPHQG